MSKNPKRPRPRWPPTRIKGLSLIVVGGLFQAVLALTLFGVFFFSLGSMLMAFWQTGTEFNALTGGGILLLLLMNTCILGLPLLGFSVFGVGLLVWGRNTLQQDKRLREYGQIAHAEIIDRWAAWKYPSTWHCVAYRFSAASPDGRPGTFTLAERNPTAYHRLRVGDSAPLRYLPEDPGVCRLQLP